MQLKLTLLFVFSVQWAMAQSIVWISDCADKSFCMNNNSCTQGKVFMTQQAVTNCNFSNMLNYSYRIDLNNNGSTDIISSEDTVNTNFAPGTHKITWKATDNCGNASTCSYLFTVKDCQPPSLLCINGLTQGLDPATCSLSFKAPSFILNLSDNCTPANQIQTGIRKFGTGSGFPSDTVVTYGKCDVGTNFVEIWVKDGNGVTNSCQNYVLVQPNSGGCSCDPDGDLNIKACFRSVLNNKYYDYVLRAAVQSTAGVQTAYNSVKMLNGVDSCGVLAFSKLPFGGSYKAAVWAERSVIGDNPLAGVSTYDLVLITRHILSIQPFTSFYQLFAADVNKSQSVTSFDVVELRKLILGIYVNLPAVPSWTFIQPVANPGNLMGFSMVKDTYQISLTNLLADTTVGNLPFVAVKYGDVNPIPNSAWDAASRGGDLPLLFEERRMVQGTVQVLQLTPSAPLELDGWQMALHLDLDKVEFLGLEGVPEENYHLDELGNLRILWWDAQTGHFGLNSPLIGIKLYIKSSSYPSEFIQLAEAVLACEAYPAGTGKRLRWVLERRGDAGVALSLPSPNPFVDQTRVVMDLAAPQPIWLEVYDLQGRVLYSWNKEDAEGFYNLTIPEAVFAGPGVYLYRLKVGRKTYQGELVKLR